MEFGAEVTIGDVCRSCNNGYLSKLDEYICQLFDEYFVRILNYNEVVDFEYNHHKLKRWLLKMCFNSARIHHSKDEFAYKPILPYIRGEDDGLGRSVQLFVQLSYPGPVPESLVAGHPSTQGGVLFEPDGHRVGHVFFKIGSDQKLLRVVHLRSYSFLLAFSEPGTGRADAIDFEQAFLSAVAGVKPLPASRSKVELVCDGLDAWTSFEDSRSSSFV